MIKLIIGNKGSGKTKLLLDLINTTTEESKGNVVCVEKGDVDIFVDATLRLGSRDMNELAAFLKRLSIVSKEFDLNFIFTISCAAEDIPESVFEVAEKIN